LISVGTPIRIADSFVGGALVPTIEHRIRYGSVAAE